MKINVPKCKVISSHTQDISIDGNPVEKVDEFTFLGSVVPGSEHDVKRRINLASAAFRRLKENV